MNLTSPPTIFKLKKKIGLSPNKKGNLQVNWIDENLFTKLEAKDEEQSNEKEP
jgi:hypothetical protein